MLNEISVLHALKIIYPHLSVRSLAQTPKEERERVARRIAKGLGLRLSCAGTADSDDGPPIRELSVVQALRIAYPHLSVKEMARIPKVVREEIARRVAMRYGVRVALPPEEVVSRLAPEQDEGAPAAAGDGEREA